MFNHKAINTDLLKEKAFNHRWAALPDGVIPLTAADLDFPCASEISEAICKFSADRYFSYGPVEGYTFFREAVANFHSKKRNTFTKPEFVMAVNSAAYGIYMVCKAMLNKGEEAIVFNPVDFLFKHSVEANNGVAVSFPVSLNPNDEVDTCLLYTSPSPRDATLSRMPSSA